MPEQTPPRLYPFLARAAPLAVVLRRGPTEWVQLSTWDTATDQFTHGQWLKAHVYQDRCDVAPDGSRFVYFAHKEANRRRPDALAYAWTAVSRPPLFTAEALWPRDSTYFGGGLFRDSRTVALWAGGGAPHRDFQPDDLTVASEPGHFIDGWPYMERLRRDGWTLATQLYPPHKAWWSVADPPSVWRRSDPTGRFVLEMHYPRWTIAKRLPAGFGGYGVEFLLYTADAQTMLTLDGATWADWDQQGRLVFARAGRLYGWPDPARGEPTMLCDFRPFTPDPRPASAYPSGRKARRP